MPRAKTIYSNPRFNLIEESVKLPDGRKVKNAFARRKPATVILAVKNSKILLIREHRVVLKGWIYELPGGRMEKDEIQVAGAKRELIEETGYDAKKILPMFNSSLNPSYMDQTHYFFLQSLAKSTSRSWIMTR